MSRSFTSAAGVRLLRVAHERNMGLSGSPELCGHRLDQTQQDFTDCNDKVGPLR